MSLASLIGIDKERYDAGNKFLSQDPYLQNFQARDPITFNISPRNTGIMGPTVYPYPPIVLPQGDGDDSGGGIIGGTKTPVQDYETDAYGLKDMTPEQKGITQEEQDLIDLSIRGYKPGVKDLAGLAFRNALFGAGILNFGLSAKSLKEKEEAFQKDIANKVAIAQAEQAQSDAGGSVQQSDDYASFGGKGDEGATGANFSGDFATDSASYDLAKGGRVGYSNGGLSTYEIRQLLNLGYDTKGDTEYVEFAWWGSKQKNYSFDASF